VAFFSVAGLLNGTFVRGLAVLGDPIGILPFQAKIGCHFKNISVVLGEEHDLDQETLSSAEFLRCIEL